jgi:glycosyltransferase involved in cell wall biosynthesis
VNEINKIIVVNDGSTDLTASIAYSMGVDVINLKKNVGKGGALKSGLDSCKSNIVVFLDADLIGINKKHIEDLLYPVMNNEADMTIGIFKSGRFTTDLAQKIAPHLSGQRALRRRIFDNIKNIDITKYGVEIVLTKYAKKNKIKIKNVVLNDLTHYMKEEKLGLIKGFSARLKMYWDILKCLKMS